MELNLYKMDKKSPSYELEKMRKDLERMKEALEIDEKG